MKTNLYFITTLLSICSVFSVSAKEIILQDLSKTRLNIITAESINCAPGDEVIVPAGQIGGLRFVDFKGTSSQPITIRNSDGQVQITELQFDGIKFDNCTFIHLTGAGHTATKYGFFVLEAGYNTAGNGVSVANFSSDVEVDHIEIRKVGFVGIMAKTDPTCDNPKTWRRNGFVLRNLKIHHNYIHDTHGEGVYIGYTGGYLIETKLVCSGELVFGHWLENVNIYSNELVNIGWDGIQVNLARKNCNIFDNEIRNYGLARKEFHNFGMSIGAGVYKIYNNTIYQSGGNVLSSSGMQLISTDSGTSIFNNVINNAAGYGIFIHSRHKFMNSTVGISVINNTIIKTGVSGILYNSQIGISTNPTEIGQSQTNVPFICQNNLITNAGSKHENSGTWKTEQENYIDFNDRDLRDAMQTYIAGNLMHPSVYQLKLSDPNTRNYQIADTNSPAYNTGVDVSKYGISFDISNQKRPIKGQYDAGAYELQVAEPTAPTAPPTTPTTLTLNGYFADQNGIPNSDVIVKGLPTSLTSNTAGKFTSTVQPNTSYTITPSKSGYYFVPEQITIQTKTTNPTDANFVIYPVVIEPTTLVQKGYITDSSGKAIPDVKISGLPSSSTSNSIGLYSSTVEKNTIYTITPSKVGYYFVPKQATIQTQTSTPPQVNFVMYAEISSPTTITIKGQISDTNGIATPNVKLSGLPASETTNSNGQYASAVQKSTSYTIIPSKVGYYFVPEQITLQTQTEDNSSVNFTAYPTVDPALPLVTLKGYIVDKYGSPASEIEVYGMPEQTITGSFGVFLGEVQANTTYIITPHKEGYYFVPEQISVQTKTSNPATLDFVMYPREGTVTNTEDIFATQNRIVAYPNPSITGEFNIKLPEVGNFDLYLFNNSGCIVSKKTNQTNLSSLQTITAGTYTLQILKNGKRIKTENIISLHR